MTNSKPLAVITGASSGIGAAFAKQLAAAGYNLVLVARRTERLAALADELRARHGVEAEALSADLIRDEDVARVCARLAASPDLALLVNNAGFGTRGLFHDAAAEQQDAMHRLHVIATERLTRAALPGLVVRNRGGVINVASVAAFLQGPGNVSYCSTKAWMVSFSQGLAIEMATIRSQVVVQALCPGYTWSEFHDVAQMARPKLPKAWWMPAEFVVADSLREFARGSVVVVPGWRYKALVRVIRMLPQRLLLLGVTRMRKPPV